MRRYETIAIIDPDVSEDDRTSLLTRIKEIIPQQDGVLVQEDLWGARKLAYPIKNKPRGYYARYDYCGMGKAVQELERFFRIDDRVLKYLTVQLDDQADVEKILAELAAAQSESTTSKATGTATAPSTAAAATSAAAPEAAQAAAAPAAAPEATPAAAAPAAEPEATPAAAAPAAEPEATPAAAAPAAEPEAAPAAAAPAAEPEAAPAAAAPAAEPEAAPTAEPHVKDAAETVAETEAPEAAPHEAEASEASSEQIPTDDSEKE